MRFLHLRLFFFFLLASTLRAQLPADEYSNTASATNAGANAVQINPAAFGLKPATADVLFGASHNSSYNFTGMGRRGLFTKVSVLAGGATWMIGNNDPIQFSFGLGAPLGNAITLGANTFWNDGAISAQAVGLSATYTFNTAPVTLFLGAQDLASQIFPSILWRFGGNEKIFDWLDVYANASLLPIAPGGYGSNFKFTPGAQASIADIAFVTTSIDFEHTLIRLGLELHLGSFGLGTFDNINSSGFAGGTTVFRFGSNNAKNAKGPVFYAHSAFEVPCDKPFPKEINSPPGLLRTLKQQQGEYQSLIIALDTLAPHATDLYTAIRKKYYSTQVRNQEVSSGDSLKLRSRHDHTIFIESIDQKEFPKLSLLVKVQDSTGRTITGLGKNDFYFVDKKLKVLSVEPLSQRSAVPVDIVFIIDESGSMADKIEEVNANVEDFVQGLAARGIDYRLGLVTFQDYVDLVLDMSSSVRDFQTVMSAIHTGGSDEVTQDAIARAMRLSFRPQAQRIFILVTDEYPIQTNSKLSDADLVSMLWNNNTRLYSVVNLCENNAEVMSRLSLGKVFDIYKPFTTILDDIGSDMTSAYTLTYETRLDPTRLYGVVHDNLGKKIPATISWDDGAGHRLSVQCDTNGYYETQIVEGFEYTLIASAPRCANDTFMLDLRRTKTGMRVEKNFTLKLFPTILFGKITDTHGKRLASTLKWQQDSSRTLPGQKEIPAGTYELPFPEGKLYRVTASNPDYVPLGKDIDLRAVPRGSRIEEDFILSSIDQAIAEGTTFKVKNIFFETAKWDLKPESFVELDRLYEFLRDYPSVNVEIGAHTDATGKESENKKLSNNRARSVMEYVISKGISETRLHSKGYGKSVPLASNDTPEGRAMNRRVEFKLVK